MKLKPKIIFFFFVMLVPILGLIGCVQNQDTVAMTQEEKILMERRNKAEAYMRSMLSVLWRAEEDVLYTTVSNVDPQKTDSNIRIVAGRIYRGIPYSFACGTQTSFLEYAGEADENGVYTISGLTWEALSGGGAISRIGNDCSGSLVTAWSQVSTSIMANTSANMRKDYGFLPVGNYETDPSNIKVTGSIVMKNGYDVMCAAYAQLQKADGVVYTSPSSNHAMMVVDVEVVYKEDGSINPKESYITVLEQTRSYLGTKYYDEKLEEEIYVISGIDKKKTFEYLYLKGYIPITCKEFIDPSPIEEAYVIDSESNYEKNTILKGNISSNWFIDAVTLTITDHEGKIVQKGTASASRSDKRQFDMQQFVTDKQASIRGSVTLDTLVEGNYHCKVVCRLTNGQEFTVRDFDFKY